jgi:phenylacetic acid degradation protein
MMAIYQFEGVVPVIDPTTFVHPAATIIGDVRIGARCYIGPGACLRGDFSAVVVGIGCNIQENAVLHGTPGQDTVLEDDAHIGHGAVVHACRVGRNALIGINAAVFDGAVIGESAIVAAMSFVPAGFVLPPGHLAAGVPARVLRPLGDDEIAKKSRGTLAYQRLAGCCQASLRPCVPLAEAEPGRRRVDLGAFWPTEAFL